MAAALVITGCESTVADTSVEPTDQTNPDGVTLALLDPGPRHPEAAASAFNMAQAAIVESFASQGLYVLYQWLQTNKPAETATELIGRTLDLQGPRIDQFVPTDPSRLASLSVDPNGLLAQTLPASPYAVTPDIGVYSAPATHVVDQLAAQRSQQEPY